MKHEFAMATQAVERYLMGDMPGEERSAFEEHYFSCEICAEDLRVTARFIENAKSVWQEDALQAPKLTFVDWLKAKWLSPAVAAVAVAALGVIVFQNTVVIPALQAPVAGPALALELPSRAALPSLHAGDPLHFLVAPESRIDTDKLWVELRSESGGVIRSHIENAPKPGEPVELYFPGTLKPGRYIITIHSYRDAKAGQQVARPMFEVTN